MNRLLEMRPRFTPGPQHDELEIPESASLTEIMIQANDLSRQAGGWNQSPRDTRRRLLLIVAEMMNAQTELSSGRPLDKVGYNDGKLQGFGPALVEAILLLCDLAKEHGIDLEDLTRTVHRHKLVRFRAAQRKERSSQAVAKPETFNPRSG